MKKPSNATKTGNEVETLKIEDYKLLNARMFNNGGVVADMEINGIRIYGVRVVESAKGDFLSFPQRKGTDGKYYSIVWAKLSETDQTEIIATIEKFLADSSK